MMSVVAQGDLARVLDVPQVVEQAIRSCSDQLAGIELMRVHARTPVDTGALLSDIRARSLASGEVSWPVVAEIYSVNDAQLATWERAYLAYQEGPPLGLTTYTNPPRQMFALALTDDLEAIRSVVVPAISQSMAGL